MGGSSPRYPPGSGTPPDQPISYNELMDAYSAAMESSECEPNLAISTLPAMARVRMKYHPSESYKQAYQWLVDNSELVDTAEFGRVRRLSTDTSHALFMYE